MSLYTERWLWRQFQGIDYWKSSWLVVESIHVNRSWCMSTTERESTSEEEKNKTLKWRELRWCMTPWVTSSHNYMFFSHTHIYLKYIRTQPAKIHTYMHTYTRKHIVSLRFWRKVKHPVTLTIQSCMLCSSLLSSTYLHRKKSDALLLSQSERVVMGRQTLTKEQLSDSVFGFVEGYSSPFREMLPRLLQHKKAFDR